MSQKYAKPCITNLTGENGKRAFETVKNAKKKDLSELYAKAEALEVAFLAKQAQNSPQKNHSNTR